MGVYVTEGFHLGFLGNHDFFMRRHCVDINILPVVMDIFAEPQRLILVHMILAEVFRSLSAYSRGHDFCEGCNRLLQIWVIEHFYRHLP